MPYYRSLRPLNNCDYTKEIWWLNVLRFVRRSTILESKPELLEKGVKKFHHNGKVYFVNHYSLSVWNLSLIMRHNSRIKIILSYHSYVNIYHRIEQSFGISACLKMETLRRIVTVYDEYVSLSSILIFRRQSGLEIQINKRESYHIQW